MQGTLCACDLCLLLHFSLSPHRALRKLVHRSYGQYILCPPSLCSPRQNGYLYVWAGQLVLLAVKLSSAAHSWLASASSVQGASKAWFYSKGAISLSTFLTVNQSIAFCMRLPGLVITTFYVCTVTGP